MAAVASGDDLKTIDGKEYKQVTVNRVEPDGIVITHSGGILKAPFTDLPKGVRERFGYDATKIKAAAIEAQRAAERERAEKERKAKADWMQSIEKFELAEKRAAQSYESNAKGSLSGQVFVSTKGGESVKLGAVHVALFASDSIDILLAGVKVYADAKIEPLREPLAAAKATLEEAEGAEKITGDAFLKPTEGNFTAKKSAYDEAREYADRARAQYHNIRVKESFYYSGAFYFTYLLSPIQTAETDAEGKFVIGVPKTGRFVIAAQAKRTVGEETEPYYWLLPVSLEGQQQHVQNLSNNNLTSVTGTSSLIHTTQTP